MNEWMTSLFVRHTSTNFSMRMDSKRYYCLLLYRQEWEFDGMVKCARIVAALLNLPQGPHKTTLVQQRFFISSAAKLRYTYLYNIVSFYCARLAFSQISYSHSSENRIIESKAYVVCFNDLFAQWREVDHI